MRIPVFCLTSLLLSGCATYIPTSDADDCALDGMKLMGISRSSDSAVAYNWQTNSTVTATSNGRNVICAVPANEEEKRQIEDRKRVLTPIAQYNDTVPGRAFWGGVGYYFFIVPGVIVKLVADKDMDAAIKASEDLKRAPASVAP